MQTQGVRQRLTEMVARLLKPAALPQPFPIETQLSELGVSSLKMVNLMLSIELEFDIAIPQADITPQNFHSIATIEALVEGILGKRTA